MKQRLVIFGAPMAMFIALAAFVSPWWLFGVLYLALLIVLDKKALRRRRHRQVLRSGDGSHNVQAGRDVNLR